MPSQLKMETEDPFQGNIAKIESIFPQCVTEVSDENGNIQKKIDVESLLREIQPDSMVEGTERYSFTWPDKSKTKLLMKAKSKKMFRPVLDKSKDFKGTKNLYVEGENYEALLILNTHYAGKIKMIYIDPPYNTGSDFIYADSFSMGSEEFNISNGEYDEDHNRKFQNTGSDGRIHTNWLNMMYPRLLLAKNLLTSDGAIVISVDDNEQANLKKICDEIFGASNYVATFPWRKRTAKSDVPFGISQDYEWILMYAKSNKFCASIDGKERKYFETPDLPGRPWRYHDLTKQTTAAERPNSYFTIINPNNGKEYPADPNRTWCITAETIKQYIAEKRIIFPGDYDFLKISKPVLRYFKEDDMKKAGDSFGQVAVSTKLPDNIGMSKDGTSDIQKLFGDKIFSFPKPVSLLKYLVKICTMNDPNATILDFFSGSGTTADAVMQLNAEDDGKRMFIMVQMNDATPEDSAACHAGYKTLCDIGEERIRRAGDLVDKSNPGKKIDTGFRVLRVDESCVKDVFYEPQNLKRTDFNDCISYFKEGYSPLDRLFHVLPELYVPFSAKINEELIESKTVYTVNGGFICACMETGVTESLITVIANRHPVHAVFCNDSMADDKTAINCDQIFKQLSPETHLLIV